MLCEECKKMICSHCGKIIEKINKYDYRKNCLKCGKEYIAEQKKQKFCSFNCYVAARKGITKEYYDREYMRK